MLIDRLGHWALTYSGQRELRVKPKAAIKLLPLALIDNIDLVLTYWKTRQKWSDKGSV